MKRSLSLKREALVALTTDEMTFVGAGESGPQPTPPVWFTKTLAATGCVTSLAGC
ncbi:MAG TPA: hypothetical protein VGX28_12500 [Frankiaceae bacterium]|nr:hypothetical protein [Frankiaceae bacterium]